MEITGSNFAPLTITDGETDLVYDYGREWTGVSYREEAQTQLCSTAKLVFRRLWFINAPERGWNDYEGIDAQGQDFGGDPWSMIPTGKAKGWMDLQRQGDDLLRPLDLPNYE